MKNSLRIVASFLSVGLLSAGLVAQTASARYDGDIQTRVTQQLAKKPEFRNLKASTSRRTAPRRRDPHQNAESRMPETTLSTG